MRLSCVILLLALLGCHTDPPDSMTSAILAALAAADALSGQRTKAGSFFRYYVKRRIMWLVGETMAWSVPPYTNLIARITSEVDTLTQYLQAKLGTVATPGPLGGAIDPTSPSHVDLKDVAQIYVDDAVGTVDTRSAKFVSERRARIQRIVWRAAALHHELWSNSDTDTTGTLDTAALDVLLDRRLRLVERMIYTDDSQGDRAPSWTLATLSSGWKDNQRTIITEYPFLNNLDSTFLTALTGLGATVNTIPNFSVEGTPAHPTIRYSAAQERIRDAAAAYWVKANPGDYDWVLKPGGQTPAQVIDLFMPSTSPISTDFLDYWKRNWIFCDHMAAGLHLEALRFALSRLHGSDDVFNASMNNGAYLSTSIPAASAPDASDLMDDGKKWFDGVLVGPSELEVGDHVIIWNNFFMRVIVGSDFGLENSIVSAVDGEDPKQSKLVGHGAHEDAYMPFVGGLVDTVGQALAAARNNISQTVAVDPSFDYHQHARYPYAFILWNPYGEDFHPADSAQTLTAPGAWWLRIQLKDTAGKKSSALSLAQALILFPKSVAFRPGKHTPPPDCPGHASDYSESIYIPLAFPKGIRGGWPAYFAAREGGTETDPDVPLEDAIVDADWAPGFFFKGPGSQIPVLRPKAKLS